MLEYPSHNETAQKEECLLQYLRLAPLPKITIIDRPKESHPGMEGGARGYRFICGEAEEEKPTDMIVTETDVEDCISGMYAPLPVEGELQGVLCLLALPLKQIVRGKLPKNLTDLQKMLLADLEKIVLWHKYLKYSLRHNEISSLSSKMAKCVADSCIGPLLMQLHSQSATLFVTAKQEQKNAESA